MKYLLFIVTLIISYSSIAQGPPILLDKPIMLGEKKGTARVFHEFRRNDLFRLNAVHLEYMYNVKNNFQLIGMLPLAWVEDRNTSEFGRSSTQGLGDVSLTATYQFIQKDGPGRSLRISTKLKGQFPTGKDIRIPVIGLDTYQTTASVVTGYESLKFGIASEIGYRVLHDRPNNVFVYKVGFGLPLLKPSYPVNQLNLFFEYEGMKFTNDGNAFFYAQGIQYARGKYIIELSVQTALEQNVPEIFKRDFRIISGFRIII